ncbi:MAG: helix-turn-helix transcriptional regulator [Clostridiales bacterium]|nr:helix-turn-helix transcriptional regulator [Candidatus Equinaster intestinalis]
MTSERVINSEIGLNSCGVQSLFDRDYHVIRSRIDYTVMYVSAGKACVYINGEPHYALPGDAILFLPDAKQEYTFLAEDKGVNRWIHFSGSLCSKLGDTPLRIVHINDRRVFESEFDALINAYYGHSDERELLLNGYLTVLLARLIENIKTVQNDSAVSEQRMADVLDYIGNNVCGSIDWNICANICCIGRDRFNHVFKTKMGISPMQYHKRLRIDYARKLLTDSAITVSECAAALGYSDINYFCRLFRKETGLSPLEYKKANTKKK